ncbi:SWIB-domain-containing protein [Pholiota conissans]|uniref:SWIB-domain-containing protein n=1 Tax=Pholiota conissans TaxID=109636 RepID=A0A9P5ZF47_9AGAR|nr:SWIB-domain-containing protein [Pholiota conissans]
MAFDFATLEPRIHEILSAPGTDLTTISAKRVRRQLLELEPSLTPEFMKDNREDVDLVIASVFEKVSGEQGADASTNGGSETTAEEKPMPSRKRKQEDDDSQSAYQDDDVGTVENSPPPKKTKKAKNGRELTDAELARKLDSEINSRSTRTGNKARGGANGAKKGARSKKSAAIVDSDGDSDSGPKKKTRKAASGTGAKGGFAKEFTLSEPLAALLQVDKLSRPQVVKQLWVYIKANELQNPGNKREILCDTNLRAVFNVDKIDMFKMNKVLGQHLHENE